LVHSRVKRKVQGVPVYSHSATGGSLVTVMNPPWHTFHTVHCLH
jgi:hypothetical protein